VGFPHPALLAIAAGRALGPVDDGDGLLTSAREHRMTGVLWTRLRADDVHVVGLDRESLAQEDLAAGARARRQWSGLTGVAERLEHLGVRGVAVKGVTAETRWYDRTGERRSTDVDLLVAPSDVGRLAAVVDELAPAYPRRYGLQQRLDRGVQNGVTISVEGVTVDLHADLLKLGPPSRTRTAIWDHVEPYTAPNGRALLVLDPAAQLFHFLLHLNKDRFPCLLGYVDVVRVVQRDDVDWTAVGHLARLEGVEHAVAQSLEVVFSTVGLPHPGARLGIRGRSRVWDLAYRPAVRLQGMDALAHRPRRLLLLPFAVVQGRGRELVALLAQRLLPARASFDRVYGRGRGPYALRVTTTRIRRALRRRAVTPATRSRRGGSRRSRPRATR
jgi:hypothetical protein